MVLSEAFPERKFPPVFAGSAPCFAGRKLLKLSNFSSTCCKKISICRQQWKMCANFPAIASSHCESCLEIRFLFFFFLHDVHVFLEKKNRWTERDQMRKKNGWWSRPRALCNRMLKGGYSTGPSSVVMIIPQKVSLRTSDASDVFSRDFLHDVRLLRMAHAGLTFSFLLF